MDKCGVCGLTEPEHAELNHVFNIAGQLVQKPKPQPKGQPGRIVTEHIAARLAVTLHNKGILTLDEVAEVLGGGPLGASDAAPRPGAGGHMATGFRTPTG